MLWLARMGPGDGTDMEELKDYGASSAKLRVMKHSRYVVQVMFL
jgi:hypothetical protein